MSLFEGLPEPQLRAALASAQLALVKLMSGEAIASVSYTQGDGAKSVSKRVTTVAECTALIMQLKRALGMPGGNRRMTGFVLR
ncbi:MAG: gpW family head-tail joining protein [Sphingomonas pseudosanguinis]|uniref:gpW family head-tail joining protein n=1 Tax=Sphingomonas pseudosanguinis TaxID=413712 RepID=UPI00391CBF33